MSRADAERRVNAFEGNRGARLLGLASHAALPAVIDAQLLHLLRVNYFLDPPETLPYTAEAQILLSPLCAEIDDGLYVIGPEERDVLLYRLVTKYGEARLRDVARLLWEYCERRTPWLERPGLTEAQQLTALNFIDSQRALSWLDRAREGGPAGDIADERWFVAMRKDLEERAGGLKSDAPAAETIPALFDLCDALIGLYSDGRAPETMALRVGLPLRPTTYARPPSTRWQELLEAAWTSKRISVVLAQADNDHPKNPTLASAMKEYWIRATPALRVENGILESAPPEWKVLEQNRAAIEASFKSVCLFMLEGLKHPKASYGLGFLIGKQTLLTHYSMVVSPTGELEQGRRRALLAFADRHSIVPPAFREQYSFDQVQADDLVRINVEAVEKDERTGACAIKFTGDVPLPPPLAIAGALQPIDLIGRRVYAMGYPVVPYRQFDPAVVERIIGTASDCLHVHPGEITGVGEIQITSNVHPGEITKPGKEIQITHNCFTVGGNGGSPLIDLQSGHVLGLHYAGFYEPGPKGLKDGRAIPLRPLLDRLDIMKSELFETTAPSDSFITATPQMLASIAEMVCRIESQGRSIGNGFLVGPDLVLTCNHVIHDFPLSEVVCRFGDLDRNRQGAAISLARDPVIASAPTPKEFPPSGQSQLDYALIRLAEPAGETRGWLPISAGVADPPRGSSISFLVHPPRGPFRVLRGTAPSENGAFFYSMARDVSRERVRGIFGAPCVDDNLNVIGILQAGREREVPGVWQLQSIAIRAITRDLTRFGITLAAYGIQATETGPPPSTVLTNRELARNEIARLVASQIDYNVLFDSLMDVLKRFMPFDWADLSSFMPRRDFVMSICRYPRGEIRWEARWLAVTPEAQEWLGQWLDQPNLYFHDLAAFLRTTSVVGYPDLHEEALVEGRKDIIAFPIRADGRVIGVLSLHSKEPDVYNQHTMEILQDSAVYQALRAIFQLRDRSEQEFISRFLNEVSNAIDVDGLAQIIVRGIARFRGFQNVSIFEADESRRQFRLLAQHSEGPSRIPEGYVQPLDVGMLGRAYRNKSSVSVSLTDPNDEPEGFNRVLRGVASALCVPIVLQKRILWILNIEEPRGYAFNKPEIEAIEEIMRRVIATIATKRALSEEELALWDSVARQVKPLVLPRDELEEFSTKPPTRPRKRSAPSKRATKKPDA